MPKDIDTRRLKRRADKLSRQAGTTAIYLARPGIDGSSGFHGYRRSWLELHIVNAALNAIRQRHGFAGFHIAGQSGGAGLIGGILTLRQDIGCAVPGAGRLALLKKPREEADPWLQFFDASQGIAIIARLRSTRIIVVTDPRDQRVEAQHQSTFVEALRRAGGQVEQFFVLATDDLNHHVAVYTTFVVGACVRGMSHQQIAQGLEREQQRHFARAGSLKPWRRSAGYPGSRPAFARPVRTAGPVQPYPPQPQTQRPYPQRAQPQQPYPQTLPPYPRQAQPQRPYPQHAQPQPPFPRQGQQQQRYPQAQPQLPFTRPVPPRGPLPPQAQPQQRQPPRMQS